MSSFVTLLTLPTVVNAQTTLHHAPRTPAEIALNNVITLDGSKGIADTALVKGTGPYVTLFTPDLVRAVRRADRAADPPNCEGVCGLGFDPIVCAQDNPPAPLYRTISVIGSNEALIGYVGGWDGENNTEFGRYRMVKIGSMWKVDGIECDPDGKFDASATKFNMR